MKNRKTLTLFLTHSCNLNCTYCYEHFKSNQKMTFALAKEILDYEFYNMGEYDFVEVNLFGGEPFLEFSLIKDIVLYLENSEFNVPYVVFITTNGTLVHGEVQDWLKLHTNSLQCALSLDGIKECHDINRSNSFNKIDLKFFAETYPEQPVKMTISQESLPYLFECVKFAHKCGFEVNCNLAFGIDWSNLDNEHILVSQLSKMCDYYIENPNIPTCSLLSKKIEISKEEYSKIVVDVCTITNGIELKANYTLTNNLVEYKIEQLSKLPEDGNIEEMPGAFKNTIIGTAEVSNGNIIKLDDASVSLPSYSQLKGAFNFNESNFKNVNASTKGTFYANVVYPSQFFGTPTSVKNVKVLVEYSITSLETITIDYETNSSIVRISYRFDK